MSERFASCFGKLVRRHRRADGMKQLELAFKLGWSGPGEVSKIENGKYPSERNPSITAGMIQRIQRALPSIKEKEIAACRDTREQRAVTELRLDRNYITIVPRITPPKPITVELGIEVTMLANTADVALRHLQLERFTNSERWTVKSVAGFSPRPDMKPGNMDFKQFASGFNPHPRVRANESATFGIVVTMRPPETLLGTTTYDQLHLSAIEDARSWNRLTLTSAVIQAGRHDYEDVFIFDHDPPRGEFILIDEKEAKPV